jgi:hypothetical protein
VQVILIIHVGLAQLVIMVVTVEQLDMTVLLQVDFGNVIDAMGQLALLNVVRIKRRKRNE